MVANNNHKSWYQTQVIVKRLQYISEKTFQKIESKEFIISIHIYVEFLEDLRY